MRDPTAASLMTREVVTARPDTPFKDLVELLTGRGLSAVPVVDDDGRPVGVVSEADLVAKEEYKRGGEPALFAGRATRRRRHKAEGATAAEVMTSPVVTIAPDAPISAAARELATAGVRRLFVVDERGRLAGVLARRDVLKAFLVDDESLRAEILRTVFQRVLWLEPAGVDVRVDRGVVTLGGKLERRSEVRMAEHVTRVLPAVVNVVNNLTYDWDDTVTDHHVGLGG
ncbi:CBS domain-containing protein [Saccharothrix mutabilis subsp. mutabilis]|uniref:CBS domain-containing protein n=1 Tax=Saccharothrix mutabilis subsp. mutabilis TaxID=66855 RepID=A0ABN0UGY0_9PSEU